MSRSLKLNNSQRQVKLSLTLKPSVSWDLKLHYHCLAVIYLSTEFCTHLRVTLEQRIGRLVPGIHPNKMMRATADILEPKPRCPCANSSSQLSTAFCCLGPVHSSDISCRSAGPYTSTPIWTTLCRSWWWRVERTAGLTSFWRLPKPRLAPPGYSRSLKLNR